MINYGTYSISASGLVGKATESYHTHDIALLEGGLLAFSLFTLILAITNKQTIYLVISIWLVSNLHVGFIALGWNHQWLNYSVPSEWVELSQRLSLCTYIVLSYMLLNRLLRSNNKTITQALTQKLLYVAGLSLLLASFFLNSTLFSSAIWLLAVVSAFSYLIIITLYIQAEGATKVKLWQLALIMTLSCLLVSCLLMAVYTQSHIVALFNAFVVLVAANLTILLAVSSHLHSDRQARFRAQQAKISEALSMLRLQIDHDPVTKVLNQRGTEKAIATTLARVKKGENCVLAYLSLNYVKHANSTYRHDYDETLLRAVSSRIAKLLQTSHDIGHLDMGEFIIIFNDTTTTQAQSTAEQIITQLNTQTINVGSRNINLQSAIGLVEVTAQVGVRDLLSAANRACREALHGHEKLAIYYHNSLELHDHAEELQLFKDLENGNSKALYLEMQPIMPLHKPLERLSFEMLLRVNDSQGKTIPTGKVIAAAEENGTISIIDNWVLNTSLNWLDTHLLQLKTIQHININLSGVSLNDDKFIEDFFATLANYSHLCKYLCIEITESVALQNLARTRHFMRHLQSKGALIALDDFGAGYTSFSYLQELPANFIKIDGGLIKDMLGKPKNIAIIRTIIELADNLGMGSIAEWVEDVDTLRLLHGMKADYVQGWAVSKAVPITKVLNNIDIRELMDQDSVIAFINEQYH